MFMFTVCVQEEGSGPGGGGDPQPADHEEVNNREDRGAKKDSHGAGTELQVMANRSQILWFHHAKHLFCC